VNGIGLQIFKTNDANTVEVSKKIKEKLNQLVNEYSKEEFGNQAKDFNLKEAKKIQIQIKKMEE
jgi:multidrug efflux pump subunit AcrB